MRILFVSNYYPPHHVGGYELHCQRVAEWLIRSGHEVRVLTSDFHLEKAKGQAETGALDSGTKPDVHRVLKLRYWKDVADPGCWLREWRDLAIFRRHLREYRPDVTVLWNMRKLAAGLVLEAQRRAPVLVYHLMDEWFAEFRNANGLPQFWARPPRSFWGRIAKPVARALYRLLLTPDVSVWRPENAVLVSKALGELIEKSGVRVPNTRVSYITYDPALFDAMNWNRDADPPEPVRFLWAGRLCEGKGLLTTLRALDALWKMRPGGWTVDFCGPIEPDLLRNVLKPALDGAPWSQRARYLGSLPHTEMPGQYRNHDVFLFTSEVHEGLPGTIIEAFAAGMAVIGTLTGGTRDVLRPDENCLIYPMGDAHGLATAMRRLIEDAGLRRSLSANVARFAREQCSNDAVFPKLEEFYKELVKKQETEGWRMENGE